MCSEQETFERLLKSGGYFCSNGKNKTSSVVTAKSEQKTQFCTWVLKQCAASRGLSTVQDYKNTKEQQWLSALRGLPLLAETQVNNNKCWVKSKYREDSIPRNKMNGSL